MRGFSHIICYTSLEGEDNLKVKTSTCVRGETANNEKLNVRI